MNILLKALIVVIAVAMAALPILSATVQDKDGVKTITQYFDLLAMGNFDIASDMWAPKALERSSRFGIEYTGVPLRMDCNSPIVRDLDIMKDHLLPPVKHYELLSDGAWSKLLYSRIVGNRLIEHLYYAQKYKGWFWLNYPQNYYADDWPRIESKYLRVRMEPGVREYVTNVNLAEVDRFIEDMADTLYIPESTLQRIADEKIEYFFCASDSTVEQITGSLVMGTFDLPSNDIISATFPHYHELVHLLVNIRLQKLPLYTLPILSEGMAVRYGGRWGKHALALNGLGVFMYKEGLIHLDSILTMRGFNESSGADIVYPLAGVFFDFLLDKMKLRECLDLYLAASGTYGEVNGMTADDVRNLIMQATGHDDWTELVADFDSFADKCLVRKAVARPGGAGKGKVILEGERFTVRKHKDWLVFEFSAAESDSIPQGNLVFARDSGLAQGSSRLFDEMYQQQIPYEGYRFAVKYDRNEAGLYDYATNQLLAKYIWGVTPSENYYDADQRKIVISFKKSLLNKQLPAREDFKLLPF